uniref:CHK domain-containing protein n=1 Tax=Parastrongyloides trichosuri TaxID=131310 RepID=A0A0N4ZE84_PARTI
MSEPPHKTYHQMLRLIHGNKEIELSSITYDPGDQATILCRSQTDKILVKMIDYVEEALIEEDHQKVIKNVNQFFTKVIQKDCLYLAVNKKSNLIKCDPETTLSMNKIMEYSKKLRINNIYERDLISKFSLIDFLIFVKNDVRSILGYMNRYKNRNITYTIPKNIDSFKKVLSINFLEDDETKCQKNLEMLYQRVVLVYSAIFSTHIHCTKFRIGILKELTFIKITLFNLANCFDFKSYRIINYIKNFYEDYKNGVYEEKEYQKITTVVDKVHTEFDGIRNKVTKYLENLKPCT